MEYFFGFMSCLSHSRKLQNRYIRHAKAQPDYAPNIRHCLYGLDADLMMLGLLSHEPHFSLLREEVHFGRERKSAGTVTPDSQNFFLMHLCLFREYLDMEFSSLKESLPFPYDVERIIDDYVLMSFFVGNDFLPHLPGLHINEGALSLMFKIYKRILPTLGGYINENGKLNLERCQKMVDGLADFEKEQFEEDMGDILFLDKKKRGSAKGGKPNNDKATASGPGKQYHANQFFWLGFLRFSTVMSMKQKEMYDQVKTFVIGRTLGPQLAFPANILARDRAFLLKLAKDLGISHSLVVSDANSEHILILELDEEDDESDEESMEARQRFCKRYDSWEVVDEEALAAQLKEVKQNRIEAEFIEWKSSYYKVIIFSKCSKKSRLLIVCRKNLRLISRNQKKWPRLSFHT